MYYGRDELCCVLRTEYNTRYVRAGSEGRRRTWFAHRANALFFVPTGSPQGPMVPFLPTLDLGCCSQRGLQGSNAKTWEWPSNLPCPKLGTLLVSVSLAQPTRLHRTMYANGVTLALLKPHMPGTAKTSQATSWLSRHTSSGGENKREREGRGMPRGL